MEFQEKIIIPPDNYQSGMLFASFDRIIVALES